MKTSMAQGTEQASARGQSSSSHLPVTPGREGHIPADPGVSLTMAWKNEERQAMVSMKIHCFSQNRRK